MSLFHYQKKYCKACSQHSTCAYVSRGLERKCTELQTFSDGYDTALNDVSKYIQALYSLKGPQKEVQVIIPKFKKGDCMRDLREAEEGITDGLPFVVDIREGMYVCNNECIPIQNQDEYEYPPKFHSID